MMKKFTVALLAGVMITPVAYAKSNLSFVGTRYFNFAGGTGTEQTIIITSKGQAIVRFHGVASSSTIYRGKFTNPLKITSYGETYYLKIQGGKSIS